MKIIVPPPEATAGPDDLIIWYRAARMWNEILKDSSSEFRFQLQPGRTLSKCH